MFECSPKAFWVFRKLRVQMFWMWKCWSEFPSPLVAEDWMARLPHSKGRRHTQPISHQSVALTLSFFFFLFSEKIESILNLCITTGNNCQTFRNTRYKWPFYFIHNDPCLSIWESFLHSLIFCNHQMSPLGGIYQAFPVARIHFALNL